MQAEILKEQMEDQETGLGAIESVSDLNETFESSFDSFESVLAEHGKAGDGWTITFTSQRESKLKRGTKEWVYEDANGNESSLTQSVKGMEGEDRHEQILDELYEQGWSVVEYTDEHTGKLVREVYFADAKGHVSYQASEYNQIEEPDILDNEEKNSIDVQDWDETDELLKPRSVDINIDEALAPPPGHSQDILKESAWQNFWNNILKPAATEGATPEPSKNIFDLFAGSGPVEPEPQGIYQQQQAEQTSGEPYKVVRPSNKQEQKKAFDAENFSGAITLEVLAPKDREQQRLESIIHKPNLELPATNQEKNASTPIENRDLEPAVESAEDEGINIEQAGTAKAPDESELVEVQSDLHDKKSIEDSRVITINIDRAFAEPVEKNTESISSAKDRIFSDRREPAPDRTKPTQASRIEPKPRQPALPAESFSRPVQKIAKTDIKLIVETNARDRKVTKPETQPADVPEHTVILETQEFAANQEVAEAFTRKDEQVGEQAIEASITEQPVIADKRPQTVKTEEQIQLELADSQQVSQTEKIIVQIESKPVPAKLHHREPARPAEVVEAKDKTPGIKNEVYESRANSIIPAEKTRGAIKALDKLVTRRTEKLADSAERQNTIHERTDEPRVQEQIKEARPAEIRAISRKQLSPARIAKALEKLTPIELRVSSQQNKNSERLETQRVIKQLAQRTPARSAAAFGQTRRRRLAENLAKIRQQVKTSNAQDQDHSLDTEQASAIKLAA